MKKTISPLFFQYAIPKSSHPSMATLIVIVGPTAVGKTALSLKLATHFDTAVVSADSRQIYRDLPIGTAAPTEQERSLVSHYFVGTRALTDYYSAAQYETDVLELLPRLFGQREVVILTGGSMLYVDAVCRGIDDIPTVEPETRQLLHDRLHAEGLDPLVAELRLLDPDYYAACDLRNPKRVVHALEVCYQTGRPFSSFHRGKARKRPFNIVKIGLDRPRAELFERINSRTDVMMSQGWLDEAKRVLPFRHENALNTVGYKELFAYLDGAMTLPEALEKIRRNTRVYAKKQLTWFRRDSEIAWFHPDDEAAVMQYIAKKN